MEVLLPIIRLEFIDRKSSEKMTESVSSLSFNTTIGVDPPLLCPGIDAIMLFIVLQSPALGEFISFCEKGKRGNIIIK